MWSCCKSSRVMKWPQHGSRGWQEGEALGASGWCGPSSSLLPFQLLRMFFRQQDEIRRLKDELSQKDIRIRQLQLELKNLRNSPKNN